MADETSHSAAVLRSAQQCVEQGMKVFPLKWQSKEPATENGFYDATDDPALVQKFFGHPGLKLNLGIRAGFESGIIVVDVDPRHGGDKTLAALEAKYGPLPKTVRARTGGGGEHIYFRHPGGRVGCRNPLAPGLDLKADGGYVVGPTSVHPDGPVYAWVPGHALGEVAIAEAPPWLFDLILRRAPADEDPPRRAPHGPASEDTSLLRRARAYVEKVPPSPEGSRNPDAFRLSGHLRQMCDADGRFLDAGVILELMREWNARCLPPMSDAELQKCIRSSGMNGTPPPPKPPRGGTAGLGGAFGGAEQKYEWPDPQPLVNDLPPVRRMTDDLIPEALRAWLRDIADRMQCPLDFLAAAMLVAIATVVGRRVAIRPKRHDDWTVVANMWGGVIGRPSLLKSPAVLEVMKALRRLEVAARKRFEEAMQAHREACAIHEAKQNQAKKDLKKAIEAGEDTSGYAREASANGPPPPVRERLLLNDATVEKLGEILNENPNGVLQWRDELVGFLRSLDREGQEPARAFYLEAWDGKGSFVYDRISRGTIDIDSVTVSIFGCIQPGPLSHYLRGALTGGEDDDGLIQRFQVLVWPDAPREWINVDRWPDTEAKKNAYAVFQRLSELTPEIAEAKTDKLDPEGIPFLNFSKEAQIVFDSWRDRLEKRVRSDEDHPAFESHMGKFRSLFPSIALLFHLADGKKGPVGVEYARMAEEWCDYLESHAHRIYSLVIRADAAAAKTLSKKIVSRTLKSPFTLRDVYQKDWAGLTSRDMVKAAVDLLIDLDWLVERVEKGPVGAPRTIYVVNPKVYPKASSSEPETEDTKPSDNGDWEEL